MEIKEIQAIEQSVVVDVICDSCGQSCKVPEGNVMAGHMEYMKLEANWGFDSGKDLEKWVAHICEKCVDEKLNFVKFLKSNYVTGSSR